MFRTPAVGLLLAAILIFSNGSAVGAPPAPVVPPLNYEIQINGESFTVEANRIVKLESKAKPGVSYSVAVRVAPTQQVRLNTIQFDYELPAKVEDDGKRENRTARLSHELGFSMLITDLGQPLPAPSQEATLKVLVQSVTGALQDEKEAGLEVGTPHQRTFRNSSALGVTIRYRDAKGIDHVYLVYVLTGPKFAASCVAEYLEHDSEDVLPLIKKTLDSVEAIPERR